jgi:hydroxymethylglutaryl-CoA lyase
MVVYISMAFGNSYEEPWGPEIVEDALIWLKDIGVRQVSLADTVGTTPPEYVGALYTTVKECIAGVELGVHLHGRAEDAAQKIISAYAAGCRRFDGALTGLGGCPFAGDELVGNIATETIVAALASCGADTEIEQDALPPCIDAAQIIRTRYSQAAHAQ